MTSAPHIELDSRAPDTLDGRQIRAAAFQDVRLEYVRATLKSLGLTAAGSGLRNQDICGFKPKDPRSLVKATLARRRGQITDEEIPPIVGFILAPHASPVVTYLGYARKVQA